jgi:hypothetical protein
MAGAERRREEPAWKAHKAWFTQDRIRREALILKDHRRALPLRRRRQPAAARASHFNGWGDWPNPNGYSKAKLHGPFEGDLVQATVKPAAVAAKMAPLGPATAPSRSGSRLPLGDRQTVIPFYEMEKAGGMAPGDPRGTAFAVERMAAGASELRDLIVDAWRASANSKVGWKPVAVQDVLPARSTPIRRSTASTDDIAAVRRAAAGPCPDRPRPSR